MNNKCKEFEDLDKRHKSREMRKKIKEVTNKRKSRAGNNCIKDKLGKMLFDTEDVTNRWVEYVDELYNDDRGEPPEILLTQKDVQY